MVLLKSDEGIVLSALPFKEHDKILTLFTESGLIKLFVKGSRKLNLQKNALCTPFTRGTYIYLPRPNSLHRFTDGTILDQHLFLRDSLDRLQTAEKMAQAVISTQWQNKPSPQLYHLFSLFLEKSKPHLLSAFLLKLMKHEGILELGRVEPTKRYQGELSNHPDAISFNETEEKHLQHLAGARNFEQLEVPTPDRFAQKITSLFEQSCLK